MDESQGIIHPEVNCLSNCESVKPNKLCTSKIKRQDMHRQALPFQKGEEEKSSRPQISLKANKTVSWILPVALTSSSCKRPEVTCEDGSLLSRPSKPYKIM